MNDDKVITMENFRAEADKVLREETDVTPVEQMIADMRERTPDLTGIIVLGWDANGQFGLLCSEQSYKDALWTLTMAQKYITR